MCLVEECVAHKFFMEMDVSAARLAQSAERKALNLVGLQIFLLLA